MNIVLAGVGSLGSVLAKNTKKYNEIDELILVDPDKIDDNNINSIFKEDDIGKYKVDVVSEKIEKNNMPIRKAIEDFIPKIKTIRKDYFIIDCRDTKTNSLPNWADLKLNILQNGISLFSCRERTKYDVKPSISTSCNNFLPEKNISLCCDIILKNILTTRTKNIIKKGINVLITPENFVDLSEKNKFHKHFINLKQIQNLVSEFDDEYIIKIFHLNNEIKIDKNYVNNYDLFSMLCEDMIKNIDSNFFNYIINIKYLNKNEKVIELEIVENRGLA